MCVSDIVMTFHAWDLLLLYHLGANVCVCYERKCYVIPPLLVYYKNQST